MGKQTGNKENKREKQHWMSIALRFGLPAFALLFVLAMIYDAQKAARRNGDGDVRAQREKKIERDIDRIYNELGEARIESPDGDFSIAAPAGWDIDRAGSDGYFDLSFRGPENLEISCLANPVPYDDFSKLLRIIERKEIDIGLNMHIGRGKFRGHQAVIRTIQLETQKLHTIDFLADGFAHHLLFAAPYELYDRYLPVAEAIFATYRPGAAEK